MTYWMYSSPQQLFTLQLPCTWTEYDDEPNVSAFFNTHQWSGNLRVTHIYYTGLVEDQQKRALHYVEEAVAEHDDARSIQLGDLLCAHYREDEIPEPKQGAFSIFYWLGACRHHRFIISFTTPTDRLSTPTHTKTMKTIERIISTIQPVK